MCTNKTIAKNHMYWVKEITPKDEVVLVNPWHPGQTPITMSYADYQKNFGDVNSARGRR